MRRLQTKSSRTPNTTPVHEVIHPIVDEATKLDMIKDAEKKFFNDGIDNTLGNKNVNKVESHQQAREIQKQVKESTPKGQNWKDVDMAIHLYLDLQENPDHAQKYGGKLKPEQKKILDMAQNLTADQKKIADYISDIYKKLGEDAKEAGVIGDLRDVFAARFWDKNGKPATEADFKFNTSTGHGKQRSLGSILEGYAEGMDLKIKGASNSLQAYREEIGNVIENKRLVDQAIETKYNTGKVDAKGNPITEILFTTDPKTEGYVKLESRAMKKWVPAGKIDGYDPEQQKIIKLGNDRDFMLKDDGTVLRKQELYAPEAIAKSLNNIMGRSKLSDNKFVQNWTKANAAIKQSILSYSGYHFIAFTRAHILSGKGGSVNPITAYKTGLNMLAADHPLVTDLLHEGMTIGRQQDFTEGVNKSSSFLSAKIDKIGGFPKHIKDAIVNMNTQFHKTLFETYGAGLKIYDGVNLYKSEIAKNPNTPKEVIAKRVAKLMNDTYGGENWDMMHGSALQNPTNRHMMSLALLAPDWTISNLRFMKKAFERGDEATVYRKAAARVVLRGIAATAIGSAISAFLDEKDDNGNDISFGQSLERHYRKAWEIGRGPNPSASTYGTAAMQIIPVDVTPLYHFIGGDKQKRAYFSIFGAYTDPIKLGIDPVGFGEAKLAVVSKTALEVMKGTDWQGKKFTTLDELIGMDDKGTYAKSQAAHKAGELSPTGKPYKSDVEGHQAGEQKGGKLAGKLTEYSVGSAGHITPAQVPSFVLSQVQGMLPTSLQNMSMFARGENDAAKSMLQGIGTGISVRKENERSKDKP